MNGRRRALIIANDQYENEGLRHLLSPAADADALGRVLGDPQIGEFDVQVVRNEPAHVIGTHIEDLFSDGRPDDVLLLHFSCHGLKSESGELFFAARNTRPNRLASTALSADFVQRCMRASRSRSIVLLLDCCYGGAFSQGVSVRAAGDVNVLDSFPVGKLGGGRGRAVISASSAMEYAFEGDQLADDHSPRPSVFTSAVVEGLATGDADRDQDGWVSLNELYDYVFDRVREQNPHQTPSRDVEMQGELYLARRRRQVSTPAPLPPELQEVIEHPLAHIRAGAVQELARLQRGRHAGQALAAKRALQRLADDDSRAVAAAAVAALEAANQDQAPDPIGISPSVEAGSATTAAERAPHPHEPDRAGPADVAILAPGTSPPSTQPGVAGAVDASSRRVAGGGQRQFIAGWGFLALLRRRRPIFLVAAAILLAAAAAAAALLILDRSDHPRVTDTRQQDRFSATAPWRLIIRDTISDMDNGCDVTVINIDGGEPVVKVTDVYVGGSFQVHETGQFRWEANDPECLVFQRSGPGKAELPFVPEYRGETDAFDTTGPVSVQVTNFNGNSGCDIALYDATNGRKLDSREARQGGGPVSLDPGGRSSVYVSNRYCEIRISAG
ncbi:caspase domain-containing protein [Micromonospora kangleipakensis]|uniref:Caspase domain-containing protein n=1 Tax=Micromonospora kangleipakensis TaxID=1077942 RepID=A0A4Q8B5H6_9ACTN|nr:caspase family protein [Micromonospora kangleipakensis]RZU72840.1 caspase domain-containing protein [Micromonospora kangleipakensis]